GSARARRRSSPGGPSAADPARCSRRTGAPHPARCPRGARSRPSRAPSRTAETAARAGAQERPYTATQCVAWRPFYSASRCCDTRGVPVEQEASTEALRRDRERYVPRGVATSDLVVTRAWGARIWDADGNELLDFAGGIACQNLGHGNAAVVRAIHEQVDR